MMKMISTVSESGRSPLGDRVLLASAMLLLLLPLSGAGEPTQEDPADKPNALQVSTFTLPETLKQGRDPFHPTSTRVIDANKEKRPVRVVVDGPAVLELKGISGTPSRPLALINNQTFAEGDKQKVNLPGGGRVEVLCLEIDGRKVRIQAQGRTRELMLRQGI